MVRCTTTDAMSRGMLVYPVTTGTVIAPTPLRAAKTVEGLPLWAVFQLFVMGCNASATAGQTRL